MQAEPTKKTLDIRREMRRCPTCTLRFSRDAAFCPHDGTKLEVAEFETLADPLVGSTVDGRYEILDVLGEGGMGRVYRVRHVSLERMFALKALRRDLAKDADLGERFIHEAKATGSVKHPNVVQINDFGRLPDATPYFVMELLVGHTLGEVIKAGGPIPAGRAVRIVKQVAAALGAAHAAGVVHRDLKPDNIFLSAGGSDSAGRGATSAMLSDAPDVRVVDFGAAKIVGSSRMTRTGIVFGTPHYMSPEQASGAPLDHRADIYALGVIMYEMFTGRVPFEADTYMGVLTQHMFVQPLPPSQVSDAAKELGALEQITLICLEKKPEDRFASMDDLVAAIETVVRVDERGGMAIAPRLDVPTHHAPPSVRYRMADELEPPTLEEMRVAIGSDPPPARPVRWWWLGALFATVFVALAVAIAFRNPSTPDPAPAEMRPLTAVSSATASATGTRIALPETPSASAAQSALSAPMPNFAVSAAPAAPVAPRPAVHGTAPRRPVPPSIDDIGDPFTSGR